MKPLSTQDTMSIFLQKQPYNLTMARHNLGIHQLRVMARTVEALQPFMCLKLDHSSPPKDQVIKIKVRELVVGTNVKPLREALSGLIKKVVYIWHHIETEPGAYKDIEIGVPIIQAYKYEHGSDDVEIQISGHLIPQIIDLARGYTKYNLQVAFNTSSPNVFKLYQYIAHFRDKKQIQCNVDTLRRWLQIEKKYVKPFSIKQQILNPAIKELKEKADVWFDIAERVTDGRKMIGWKFNIYSKPAKKEPKKELEKAGGARLEEKKKRLMVTFKLGIGQAKKVIDWLGTHEQRHQALNQALYDVQILMINHKLQNVGGYTAKILKEKLGIEL